MKAHQIVARMVAVAATAWVALAAPARAEDADELERIFEHPPEAAKPGMLWFWMGCNLSKEGITRDLEAFMAAGINNTTMFHCADTTTPWAGEIGNSPTPEIISWTEPWWKLVRHAAEESKRLGMDFAMLNGTGYESSGGPWITVEHSMQELCFSQTPVSGPGRVSLTLPRPTVDPRGVQPFPMYNPNTGQDLTDFAVIPAGNFTMGDTLDGLSDTTPHTVNVSAFYMQKKETSKAQWDEVRAWGVLNGCTNLAAGAGTAAEHPVQAVTWYDVVKWCNAKSEMENLTPCYYTDAAQTMIYKTGNTSIDNTMVKWSTNG